MTMGLVLVAVVKTTGTLKINYFEFKLLIISCLWMSCYPCIILLICDKCFSDYFMYTVCVSIGRFCSV